MQLTKIPCSLLSSLLSDKNQIIVWKLTKIPKYPAILSTV